MYSKNGLLLLLSFLLFANGCGGGVEAIKATVPGNSGGTGVAQRSIGIESPTKAPAAANPVSNASQKNSLEASTAAAGGTNLDYITPKFTTGLIARPRQLLQSKFGRELITSAFDGDEFNEVVGGFKKNYGIAIDEVTQMAVLMQAGNFAANMGIEIPGDPSANAVAAKLAKRNAKLTLMEISLAFHNYLDVYRNFPNANGNPNSESQLSWRVEILPYIGEFELYHKFNRNEPWDSRHNKALLSEMPDIFKTPGAGPGKTSLHVVVGKGAPFSVEKLRFRDVTDGSSKTLLAAVGGADTAAEWTKPGGVELNHKDPWQTFGKIGDEFMVLLMNGTVRTLERGKTTPEQFRALMTHQAGDDTGLADVPFESPEFAPIPYQYPTLVIHTSVPISQRKAIEALGEGFDDPVKKTENGIEFHDCGGYAIWFPTDKSVVATQAAWLPEMKSNKGGSSSLRDAFTTNSRADFVAAVDAASMPAIKDKMMEKLPPQFALAKQLQAARLIVDGSSAGEPMAHIDLETGNEESAGVLKGFLGGFLLMGQQQLATAPIPPEMSSIRDTFSEMIKGVEIQQNGNTLTYEISKPEDYDGFIGVMKPQFKELGKSIVLARKAAKTVVKKNKLKEIGLAFHNFHDVYGSFGAADGSVNGREGGLSWRVRLLPYFGEAQLYERFKRDQPWDSDHNKKLIAEMPDVFKTEAVTDEGKTAFRILVGKSAPFKDGKTDFRMRDCVDGLTTTILVVEAGADKAQIWTKPGGLEVNQAKPFATVGKIGESFMVVFGDGLVHSLSKTIDRNLLYGLMTSNGGEVIDRSAIHR